MIMRNVASEYVRTIQIFLSALGSKLSYPEIEVQGRDYSTRTSQFRGIDFIDTRFPTMPEIGHVMRVNGKYLVHSRLIANKGFCKGSWGFNTLRTTDVDKAVKQVLMYIKPYSVQEVIDRNSDGFNGFLHDWQSTPDREFRSITAGVTRDMLVEEVKALTSAGVQFHTSGFQRVAAEGVAMFEEAARRRSTKYEITYVNFATNGTIYTKTERRHDNEGTAMEATYQSFDELPEHVRVAISLLNMVENDKGIGEIGFKIDDHQFFVLREVE